MSKPDKPFFVGYLAMPAGLRKFYAPLAIALVALSALAGFAIGSSQKAVPAARWNTAATTTLEGILTVSPYPVLHRADPDNPQALISTLLVLQGKHAADEIAARHDGKPVSVSGFAIERGGWSMLEITGAEAIAVRADATGDSASSLRQREALGEVSLKGEIVDSKCFLGVMKPGAGPVHRACAEMCLLGRLPPLLAVEDDAGRQYGYLLVGADGGSASLPLAGRTADAVEISGQLYRHGDLLYLQMAGDPTLL